MRRSHRRAHARIWMALAILLPLVVFVAMVIRQQGPLETRAERYRSAGRGDTGTMSVRYRPVLWNASKYIYDVVLLVGVFLYIWMFLDIAPAYQTTTRPISGAANLETLTGIVELEPYPILRVMPTATERLVPFR